MINKVDRELARQHGVISRGQARKLGLSERQIDHRVASGTWVKVLPCVYRDAAATITWEQGLIAAWLWSGPSCVVSHRAAAKLFGMMGIETSPYEISSPQWKRAPLASVIVHTTSVTGRSVRRHGIALTDPTRTLCELGAVVDEETLEVALEDSLLRGLTSEARLRAWLDAEGGQGRRGCGAISNLLEQRCGNPAESYLEVRAIRALRKGGLPAPERQYRVSTPAGNFRADLAYLEEKLIIECDSRKFHLSPKKVEADLRRRNALEAEGFRVVHATWDLVVNRPDEFLWLVSRMLSRSPIIATA